MLSTKRNPQWSSVISVKAPCPGNIRLSIHPDFPDDSLPLLQPLRSLQLFSWCEHVHVKRAFKSPVPPRRQIWSGVPVWVRVTGIGRRVGRTRSLLGGRPLSGLTVGATGDLDHQSEECEEESQTDTADEEECCPFWVVWMGGRESKQVMAEWDI